LFGWRRIIDGGSAIEPIDLPFPIHQAQEIIAMITEPPSMIRLHPNNFVLYGREDTFDGGSVIIAMISCAWWIGKGRSIGSIAVGWAIQRNNFVLYGREDTWRCENLSEIEEFLDKFQFDEHRKPRSRWDFRNATYPPVHKAQSCSDGDGSSTGVR
jgi:hypothetical protein